MNYRNIGKWGIKVSDISIGSWMTELSGSNEVQVAKDTIRLAYDQGINFFDCADAYSGGNAERFLGDVLKDYRRSSLVLSSKVYFPVGSGPNDRGLSRKHIMEQIDQSLLNMKTDYLDLYFCHRYDVETPLEETLQAMSDLVVQGKILYYGVSEWSPVQLTKAVGMIKDMGLRPMSVIQPQYNMMDRFIEDEIMGICEDNGIGIVPFSPLSQGLLTGKYRKGMEIPKDSRATHQADKQINNLMTDDNLNKVEQLLVIADGLGLTLSQLALAWALRRPVISSLITGATKPEQLESNIKASGVVLSNDTISEIENILNYKPFYRKIG